MFHCIYRLWVVGQRNLPTRVADLLLASSLLFGVIKTFFPIIFQLKQINYRRSFTLLVVDKYLLVFSYLSAKHFNFLWIVCCTLFYKNVQPEILLRPRGGRGFSEQCGVSKRYPPNNYICVKLYPRGNNNL